MKKSGLRKLLIGTGLSTAVVLIGAGLLLIMVIGMYTTMVTAIVSQEEALRASAGEPMGNGDLYSVLDQALTYIGTPYELGGASYRAIDCSGLSLVSYRDAGTGITLPHATWEQVELGEMIYQSGTKDYFTLAPNERDHPALGQYILYVESEHTGLPIPVLPGDLIFFSYGGAVAEGHPTGHVGIYIGNGQYVHAINETNRTYISKLYNIYGGNFYPPTSIYAIRRYLGVESILAYLEKTVTSDLSGYPITIPYTDVQLLAKYIHSKTATLPARERHAIAVEIISKARMDQTSINEVIRQKGGTESVMPDMESWRIVRCSLLGSYVDPY